MMNNYNKEAYQLKTLRIKTYNGELILYKNVIEFLYGKSFFVLILLEGTNHNTKIFHIKDLIRVELKKASGVFSRINLYRHNKKRQKCKHII